MRRKIGQWLLIVSGILALLGGGSCFLFFVDSLYDKGIFRREEFLGLVLGIYGAIALIIAIILGLIGLIIFKWRRTLTKLDLEEK
jgi:hypothetical protein